MGERWTVGAYLARRMEQAGAGHVFGVPGDYCLPFFDDLVASGMELVVTCNELNAGYAADGYARLRGVGAVAVTYDVGGFSILNAIAGAHAERVPVIVVSGAPRTTTAESRHLLHHMTGDLDVQFNVFLPVTEAAVQLTDAATAPDLIDAAIIACLRERRPCYIELPLDVSGQECRAPRGFAPVTTCPLDSGALREAVAETVALLDEAGAATERDGRPGAAIMAGVEVHRLGVRAELKALVERLGCPFVTTVSSKTVLPETHPQFAGVYIGALGRQRTQDAVEQAEVILSLGAIMSDLDLGLYTGSIDPARLVVANSERVRIGHHVYDQVALGDFIRGLREAVPAGFCGDGRLAAVRSLPAGNEYVPDRGRELTVERFYARMRSFLEPGCVVLADAGDSVLAASDLPMPEGSTFLAQGYYLSIGWTVPATLGAMCAEPGRRAVTFVGDGAFQMTAQELSSIVRLGQNPIIFIADNEGFVIERFIHDGPYNDINPWRYADLPAVFGGPRGLVAETEGDLEDALGHAAAHPDDLVVVQVKLGRDDASETLRRFGLADG